MSAPELSVVLPIYNEGDLVAAAVGRVRESVARTGRSYELICIDDGSTDATGARLAELAAADPAIVPVTFSRNFGKEAALCAGLELARGRAVLFLDADLQHPPERIPEFVRLWEEGWDVVEGVKTRRGPEGPIRRGATRAFYALMSRAAGFDLDASSDFKLLDRQVVDALLRCSERTRFFRGLVAWVGFRVARVPFQVEERAGGRSKWSFRALVAYSLRNLVAFSAAPLRLVAWLGFATILAGVLLAAQTFWNWLNGSALSGFTTVILLVDVLCGLILLSLGVLGYYVSQLYEEQKARPIFVVREARAPVGRPEVGSIDTHPASRL
jgi:dolichol-phosphate mannosyltransferase